MGFWSAMANRCNWIWSSRIGISCRRPRNCCRSSGRALKIRLILHPVPGYLALLARVEANDYHLAPFNDFGPDPAILATYFTSDGNRNWSRYREAALDDLLTRAGRSQDENERREAYARAQQAIMREALVLPLVEFVNINAASRRVVGLQYDPYGWFPLLYPVGLSAAPE